MPACTIAGMLTLQESAKETDRFKRLVCRGFADEINKDVVDPILRTGADLVILRTPVAQAPNVQILSRTGVQPMIADTLVYYSCDLQQLKIAPLKNADLKFVRVEQGNRHTLTDLVGKAFADYSNHYTSNPLLDREDIRDGFVEWAQSFDGSEQGRLSWIAMKGETPVAFCNCAVTDGDFEGVLYGVHPEFAGHGIYGDLVSFTQEHALKEGFARMVVSTQIQNQAVQKAWVRRGFHLERSVYTVHLNLHLSEKWHYGIHREAVQWSRDDIAGMGKVSGDTNPVHFDDAAAKEAGFKGVIAHGILINGAISRVLGTKCPGSGAVYLSQTSNFLAPVYPGEKYELQVAVKHVDPRRKFATLSTSVRGSGGERVFTGVATVKVKDADALLRSASWTR